MNKDLFLKALAQEIEKAASEPEVPSMDKIAEDIVNDFLYEKLAEELVDNYIDKMADEMIEAGGKFDAAKALATKTYGKASELASKTWAGTKSIGKADQFRAGVGDIRRHVKTVGLKEAVKNMVGKGEHPAIDTPAIRKAVMEALKGAGKTGALYGAGAAGVAGAAYGGKKLYDKSKE